MQQQDADAENHSSDLPIIQQAKKVEWVQDPLGFFTIKPFPEEDVVKVRFYEYTNKEMTKWKIKHLFEGNDALEIFQKIFEMDLISRLEHAAYLGKEIERALLSLKHKFAYKQS